MVLSDLENDNVPEIKLAALEAFKNNISQDKPLLLTSHEEYVDDMSDISKYYDIMKQESYDASCNNCSHCNLEYDYCEKKKETIYDASLYAFGCKEFK